ncbi:MAG: hypothetical protein PHW95_01800 [Patescibacteria group bacterium]|nr:hypothetical protein [Patescibacteria group bacterium]
MAISSIDLVNLPVQTKGGRNLGKVSSFDLEFEGEVVVVMRYYVKTGLIQGLWHQQLIIDRSQVIAISKEKMIVDDNTIKEKQTNLGDLPMMVPTAK